MTDDPDVTYLLAFGSGPMQRIARRLASLVNERDAAERAANDFESRWIACDLDYRSVCVERDALAEACRFAMKRLEAAYHGDEEEQAEARRENAQEAATHAAWADKVLADHPEYQRFKAALALSQKPEKPNP